MSDICLLFLTTVDYFAENMLRDFYPYELIKQWCNMIMIFGMENYSGICIHDGLKQMALIFVEDQTALHFHYNQDR